MTGKPAYRRGDRTYHGIYRRELSNGEGAFYSALDADSEGMEGKYYVWDKAEIDRILGEDAELFCTYYGVTEAGNWEGKNILTRAVDLPVEAAGQAAGLGSWNWRPDWKPPDCTAGTPGRGASRRPWMTRSSSDGMR